MATHRNNRRVHDALIAALAGVRATGFATRGTLSAKDSNIGIGFTVKGIGEIKLPLEPDDPVWYKLKDKGESKSHGTWEIDAADVSFVKQPLWNAWVHRMGISVKKHFGIPDGEVVIAEPDKLLIRERGAHVEPRQRYAKNYVRYQCQSHKLHDFTPAKDPG